ncbi:DUF1109 domain-containing protein [Bosea sp. BH3]|uniref:DUF1109 domain-containing protein n=1 Tax=Bosea sp. BH3 TaxID=2871701 RepID=UPI0021CB8C27|nr:DUF1109 domain-containing protein [Bosea sp. BH3]MCU4181767.1 DUF1109 domain-containing protein [Bosea sp. BH3]
MQTDDLISMMTAEHRKVDTGWLRRATWLAALAALGLTITLILGTLGARADFAVAWMTLPVIAKALLGASLALVALAVFQRSLRPGLKPGRWLWLALAPPALAALWALATLAQAPTESWSALIFGRNWRACLIAVPLYAIVPFVILILLARRGAPVDGRLTGTAAGIASAGLAIVGYSLHCPDDTTPFLATWYPIAVATVTALATMVAPRLLRW